MGKLPFTTFIGNQWTRLEPVLTADLTGKTVVVVGANTGIGFEAAQHFARMGPKRLVLACRNEQRGRDAAARIAKQTSYAAEVQLVDLSDFASVVAFTKRLENDPIDILVANAGVNLKDYRATKDGWEETIHVNHLSTSLLSLLLLPNLVKAAEQNSSTSRLVIVGSETHFWTKFDSDLINSDVGILKRLNDKEYCTSTVMFHRYFHSKLLNTLFTRALATHLSRSVPIAAASVNPGMCSSELGRNRPGIEQAIGAIMRALLGRTAEQGARQLVWAALGPDGKEGPHVKQTMHGAYVSIAEVREPSDFVISKEGWEAQEKVWNETIDILSEIEPSVRAIVEKYSDK
ncbi:hypothetical protein BC629DRAFT_1589185 [Irpex lacteus]|nr:hypothetical protein BC629DRAFT_1589185 [Irpex lacteus]